MTVQPERKVTEATDMTPAASSTGFMTIPPPMPQTVPMIQAAKVTRKQIRRIAFSSDYLRLAALDPKAAGRICPLKDRLRGNDRRSHGFRSFPHGGGCT